MVQKPWEIDILKFKCMSGPIAAVGMEGTEQK